VIVPATALAAGTGSLSLSPSTVSTSTGSTFYVDINTQATVPMSGAQASINFDPTKVQVVSVAKPTAGTGWNVAGPNYVLPSAAAIGAANLSGHLVAIGAFFSDGTSSLPANTNEVLARVTFFATATGSTTVSLPTVSNPNVVGNTAPFYTDPGSIIDGTTGGNYGSPVTVTSTGSTITITAGTGGNSSATTNVTGTVDTGFVSLSCPTAVTIPLARNALNVANFECQIGSNSSWNLSVLDTNPDPATHGYMRDTVQGIHLHDSLLVHSNPHLDNTPPPAGPLTVYDSDVNLAASPTAQLLASGQNNVNEPLAFTQFAAPNDAGGNYGAQVLFSIVTGF
jgi:hypothetical protein